MAGLCLGELLTEKPRRGESGRVLSREPVDAPLPARFVDEAAILGAFIARSALQSAPAEDAPVVDLPAPAHGVGEDQLNAHGLTAPHRSATLPASGAASPSYLRLDRVAQVVVLVAREFVGPQLQCARSSPLERVHHAHVVDAEIQRYPPGERRYALD